MITHEDLVKEYKKQLLRKDLGSTPVRMFDENGKFNKDNWNGGDSNLIRKFLDNINCNEYKEHLAHGFYNINKIWDEDTTYAVITESYLRFDDDSFETNVVTTTYVISWYKSRGRIDSFTVNGVEGDESDYIDLLNMLNIKIEY